MTDNASADPRRRRSRAALEGALWGLLGDKDLHQISISDITRVADVNRSTFYDHYTDVHDLAAHACTAMFDQLVASAPVADLSHGSPGDLNGNPLVGLFDLVEQHASLFSGLLGPDGSARVINHLRDRMAIAFHVDRRTTGREPATHAADPDSIPHDPEAAWMAGALVGVAADWLQRGCPGSSQTIADEVWPLLMRTTASEAAIPGEP